MKAEYEDETLFYFSNRTSILGISSFLLIVNKGLNDNFRNILDGWVILNRDIGLLTLSASIIVCSGVYLLKPENNQNSKKTI